jgi:DNA-binding LacI/PurR family transcriptional regulator
MKTTLKDIALKAKVSRMTVSRVFSDKNNVSEKTSERIKKIALEMGYHPNLIARSLSSSRSMTIGVFIPKARNVFLDTYITQILSGISDVIQQLDYRIMFFPFDYNRGQKDLYVSIAKSNLVDGIILLKTRHNDEGIKNLAGINFPFVLVNHKMFSKTVSFVDSRNIKGSQLAVEYLYNLGHRKIAFVAGTLNETNAADRFTGYKKALLDLKLPFRKEWIIYGKFSKEEAYKASKELFKSKKLPTAIFCSDDYMAIGVMESIKESGLSVPGDISVIGFDNIELSSYLKPSLTTVNQPIYEIGKKSTEYLLDLIEGKRTPPIHEFLDVDLVIRESTSSPK